LKINPDRLEACPQSAKGIIFMEAIETKSIELAGVTYRISLYPDHFAENPLQDWSEMGQIFSLNRRHENYDPEAIEAAIRSNPDAVPLSYYEHGLCRWAVSGEFPMVANCPFDSVSFAGLWLPDAETIGSASGLTQAERRRFMEERARQAAEVYTQWCNGEVYGFEIERMTACTCCGSEQAEPLESCWSFYGFEDCLSEAERILAAITEGEAA
jgi:hypothetical protein